MIDASTLAREVVGMIWEELTRQICVARQCNQDLHTDYQISRATERQDRPQKLLQLGLYDLQECAEGERVVLPNEAAAAPPRARKARKESV